MDNENLHINRDVLIFFDRMADVYPLYAAVERKILEEYPNVKIKAQKTQITFANKHGFAFVSLPVRRRAGWPQKCIVLSFGLNRQIKHPRIDIAVEPYPNRWTHHVVITHWVEVDEQIMDWIREAHDFAETK